MSVSVAIVSMNRGVTLAQTVVAVLEQSVTKPEIIVVDNGSTQAETVSLLCAMENDGHRVIRNTRNLGLSVAVNQGLDAATGDVLVHLDDDALIQSTGWDDVVSRLLTEHAEIGVVMPGESGVVETLPRQGYVDTRWALGMAWAMRREVYEDIGGYDPQLMHQNECDLCVRVRLSGRRVALCYPWHVFHNDPGGPRTELAEAREKLGTYQYRSKYNQFFRGRQYHGGSVPLYLTEAFPPDEAWLREWALFHHIDLNPGPPHRVSGDLGISDAEAITQGRDIDWVQINGGTYAVWRSLRSNYCFWDLNVAHEADMREAAATWERLTGERWEGYQWKPGHLKP